MARKLSSLSEMFQHVRVGACDMLDAFSEEVIGWSVPPPRIAMDDAAWQCERADSGTYCLRCGDSTGPGEATDAGCGTCREGAELDGGIGEGVIRLGSYVRELRRWVLMIKFLRWEQMGYELGVRLGHEVIRSQRIDPHHAVVVPMPMPWLRRLYRGTDHAQVIASGVAKAIDAPVWRVMYKKNGMPQTKLPRGERRRTSGRDIGIRRRIGGWNLKDAHVVLVDDVRTTGASLRSAVRLLRTLGPAKMVCAVVAVSDSRARRERARAGRSLGLELGLEQAMAEKADERGQESAQLSAEEKKLQKSSQSVEQGR
jgi:predicted amidophosphoribosyltransferase